MIIKLRAFLSLLVNTFICCSVASSTLVYAEQSKSDARSSKGIALDEISIIGNTELPNVSFELPWKLPTIQKRSESHPLEQLEGMLEPIDPIRHKRKVFFSQYLELDVPNYSVK